MCNDAVLKDLNNLGYNMVRLPRENINPLLVITKSNSNLVVLGKISDFVTEKMSEPPEISQDQSVAEISSLKTGKLKLGVGLSFLKEFLSSIGAAEVGLKASFKNAYFIQFVYQNVLTDSVYPTAIGKYLSSVSPDITGILIDNIDNEGESYIITDTLKSNFLSIVAYDSKGMKLDLDISALQQLLNATPKFEFIKDKRNAISFKGEEFLRFAFKAIAVWVEIKNGKARFRLSRPGGPTRGSLLKALPSPQPVIFGKNTLINIK